MNTFDQDFKLMIVQLSEAGHSTKELSEEYGVSKTSVNTWRRQYKQSKGNFMEGNSISLSSEEKRIRALEKQVKDLKLERDILKKAVSIFSKND